jgi:phosphotransferase system HPr (HPr) family protein
MVTFIHKISDPNGLHAINAARLARFCRDCPARVRVACRDTAADARQMMGLMKLRAKQGDVLEFRVEGTDEEDAAEKLKVLAGELL